MASRSSHVLLQVATLQVALQLFSIYYSASADPCVHRSALTEKGITETEFVDVHAGTVSDLAIKDESACMAWCDDELQDACAGCTFEPLQGILDKTQRNSGWVVGWMQRWLWQPEPRVCAIYSDPDKKEKFRAERKAELEKAEQKPDLENVEQKTDLKTIKKRNSKLVPKSARSNKKRGQRVTTSLNLQLAQDGKSAESADPDIKLGPDGKTALLVRDGNLFDDDKPVQARSLLERDAELVVDSGRLPTDVSYPKEEVFAAGKARMELPFADKRQVVAQQPAEVEAVPGQRLFLARAGEAAKGAKQMATEQIAKTKIQVADDLSSAAQIQVQSAQRRWQRVRKIG